MPAHTHTQPSIHRAMAEEAAMQRPWPAHQEQFGGFGVLLKDTSTCCQEGEKKSIVISVRPASLALPPPNPYPTHARPMRRTVRLPNELRRNTIIILEDDFFFNHAFFCQALWVFTNCRKKNILYDVGWHVERCIGVDRMFSKSFS